MKRLFIVASLAIMAVGCQKTTVQNEVLTPIGFDTELVKQTRADDLPAYEGEDFGVFSYAFQNGDQLGTDPVMPNEKVTQSGSKWVPSKTYYWPNDPETTLDFYAYAPYRPDIEHSLTEGEGFTFDYTHENQEYDFMLATPVKGANYASTSGTVDVVFNHEMTQVQFNVAVNGDFDDVTFKLEYIELVKIPNKATYTSGASTKWDVDYTATTTYELYNESEPVVIGEDGIQTNPVTMIPQDLANGQQFKVKYHISGEGVATEPVTRTIDIKGDVVTNWTANKKVVYNLTIGLQTIDFAPYVNDWDEEVDEQDHDITPEA